MQLELFAPRAPTVFVRHRRARRYILRLLDDGTLRVTLPRWGSKREAQAFVERSSDWIGRQLFKHQSAAAAVHPDEPLLRARAARELPPRLLALATEHDITVTSVSIRNQRSRWRARSVVQALGVTHRPTYRLDGRSQRRGNAGGRPACRK